MLNVSPSATKAEIRSAYRELARRWHPDRFMEGPERDWANEKMSQINAAYRQCLSRPQRGFEPESDSRALKRIEELIDGGQYSTARSMLMSVATRCAEWNYLFGALMLKMKENKKALIYLGVAARQQPENSKYIHALREAEDMQSVRLKLVNRIRRFR